MQNKNVNEMSVVELKAIAYDLIVQFENIQNNLKIINGEIAERNKIPVNAPTPVTEEIPSPYTGEEKKEE